MHTEYGQMSVLLDLENCPVVFSFQISNWQVLIKTGTSILFFCGSNLQGAPIKTIPWEKFIISVTLTDFFTIFTAFTEEDSGHIYSKLCYNICYGLKFTII